AVPTKLLAMRGPKSRLRLHNIKVSAVLSTADMCEGASTFLSCRAGCRIPAGRVGQFFEIRTGNERLTQILRIIDDAHYHKPLVAVRACIALVILGQHGVRAVGSPILT